MIDCIENVQLGKQPPLVALQDSDFYMIIIGGPFRQCPEGLFSIKMAAEIDRPCDVSIPTEDFSVPPTQALRKGIMKTLAAMARIDDVDERVCYAGCMGGIGRTGLFMAAMAKTLGYADPIATVRSQYKASAVETRQQENYINDLYVDDLRRWFKLIKRFI